MIYVLQKCNIPYVEDIVCIDRKNVQYLLLCLSRLSFMFMYYVYVYVLCLSIQHRKFFD